ncbi:MAG: nitrate reductase [Rhodospirillaceae bacterium]|nr:nitrate reductase [Rhodospirillaceae bacterium]
MDDILGLSRAKPDGSAQRIKDLVRRRFGLDDSATLMVSELRCHEDGCPDVETVIAVMGAAQANLTWKIAKPMARIDAADIAALSATERA